MKKVNKSDQYSTKLLLQIQEMFEDESGGNYIDRQELTDPATLKDFLHAVMNIVPTMIFCKMTGDDKNMIEVNHVANQLLFEYMLPEKSNSK